MQIYKFLLCIIAINAFFIIFFIHGTPSSDLVNELSKVDAAGGIVLQEKALITQEIGYWGVFLDTEGNRIGIHSRK